MGVLVSDRITGELVNIEQQFKTSSVTVGIDASAPPKVKMAAYMQEFGFDSPGIPVTPKMRRYLAARGFPLSAGTKYIKIPARPFISAGIIKNQNRINGTMGAAMRGVLAGKITMQDALNRVGEVMVASVTQYREEMYSDERHPLTLIDRSSGKSRLGITNYLTYATYIKR